MEIETRMLPRNRVALCRGKTVVTAGGEMKEAGVVGGRCTGGSRCC